MKNDVYVLTIGNINCGVYSSWRLAYLALMNWLSYNSDWYISGTTHEIIYDEFKLCHPEKEEQMANIEEVILDNQYWLENH